MSERDLVLIGGGHCHALLIRRLAMKPLPGVRVTLISEHSETPYSGMLPGLIAGHYDADNIHIDLNRLCRWAGVRFIRGRVNGLDADAKRIQIENQPDVSYDKVSIDTGSTPDLSVPGARDFVVGVKPVSRFYARWKRLLKNAGQPGHWGVVGAGAGGIELILAMAHRLGPDRSITLHLIHHGAAILPGAPKTVRRQVEAALQRHGIVVHRQFRVHKVTATSLVGNDDQTLALDQMLWCTSAAAPDWPAQSGLALADNGFIAVNPQLQSTSHPDVFAAGDVAELIDDPRPKAGVYAVREAPFLYDNLKRAFASRSLQPIRLQNRFLSLISLGDKTAVGHRGPWVIHGAWVWRWKDRIDRAFMDRFQALGAPSAMMQNDGADTPHCAGCGSKLAPTILADTLDQLPRHNRPGFSPALGRAEDAASWQATPGHLQVQSIDGFRAFSDDLYRFGHVGVLHALSDLHAMGAQPIAAQVWVTLAYQHPRLQKRDYDRLMSGIADALYAEDVVLAGGHSTEGPENQLALVAQGEVAPERLWSKQGGQPGDVLVLTKALGTGVILAADMAAAAPANAMEAAWASMTHSNQEAAAALRALRPSAVTDVTGFGLLGHLLEMLGDDVGAQLESTALPALEGSLALFEAGWQSSLVPHLMPYLNHCQFDAAVPTASRSLLLDPQTSGGLLIALNPTDWPVLQAALPGSVCIGQLTERAQQPTAVVASANQPL
ncbi:selenide, water dikinase SelD [Saccharospirillum sp. MSK14-1]|uniref:selenide, water dikinase SelD n=1 Tax=Saccharospirillum sp. MSK14-1 TaxID=1897632 RepID=UPI000D36518E|nr:selenide, water dikinase SelD [Saccharospirillum sp. MSK14-1]PTY37530.1 selenide, water dikinase SelD [Saccharospirillum sp. MSK14-1]